MCNWRGAQGKAKEKQEGHPVSVIEPVLVLRQKSLHVTLRTLPPGSRPRGQPEQLCVTLTSRLGGADSTLPARKWIGSYLWPLTAQGVWGHREGTSRPCPHPSLTLPGCWWQREEGKGGNRGLIINWFCASTPTPLPAGSQNSLFPEHTQIHRPAVTAALPPSLPDTVLQRGR